MDLVKEKCQDVKLNMDSNILKVKLATHMQVSKNILIAHAITGCDTVSAIYDVGNEKNTEGSQIKQMEVVGCL